MKLLVISHTPHYLKDNQIVGWGSTVREIDQLATLFDEVVHLAPLHSEKDPGSSLPYQSFNVRFCAVRPAGGDSLWKKFQVGYRIPEYIRAMIKEIRTADIIHVRTPAAISLLALILLIFSKQPAYRWVKYAGNWNPQRGEPLTYRMQRWIIKKNFYHGIATINGKWPNQPNHIRSFYNPCLTKEEVISARKIADEKKLTKPYQILFVGRLESAKGADKLPEIISELLKEKVNFHLSIIGDGPEHDRIKEFGQENQIEDKITFTGWLKRENLSDHYAKAHFLLLPSNTEGWPKVLSEGMAFGVVVLASKVSCIPQILAETDAGVSIEPTDLNLYTKTILHLVKNPHEWYEKSHNAAISGKLFSYTNYLAKLKQLFSETWKINLN